MDQENWKFVSGMSPPPTPYRYTHYPEAGWDDRVRYMVFLKYSEDRTCRAEVYKGIDPLQPPWSVKIWALGTLKYGGITVGEGYFVAGDERKGDSLKQLKAWANEELAAIPNVSKEVNIIDPFITWDKDVLPRSDEDSIRSTNPITSYIQSYTFNPPIEVPYATNGDTDD